MSLAIPIQTTILQGKKCIILLLDYSKLISSLFSNTVTVLALCYVSVVTKLCSHFPSLHIYCCTSNEIAIIQSVTFVATLKLNHKHEKPISIT